MNEVDFPTPIAAAWAVAGAFVYAAPKLMVCIKTCRASGEPISDCWMEFGIALITGGILGAAWGLVFANHLGNLSEHHTRAVTVLVGLLANPAAPGIIRLLSAKNMLQAALKSLGGKA